MSHERPDRAPLVDDATHRDLAIAAYQRCWEILDSGGASDGHVELLTCAFASRWHWRHCGGPREWAISDWMVSRAAATAGDGGLALVYARRAHDALDDTSPDWMRASAAEGMALAYRVAGPAGEYDHWVGVAARLVESIIDDDDRELISAQLAATRSAR
ncbi:MAG: hypothetical protein ACRDV0_08450 [Acidimicrobiales bacterium]